MVSPKEVENVISEEFGKESATYFSILTAIALGKTKANAEDERNSP
jgi:hypothetical protein